MANILELALVLIVIVAGGNRGIIMAGAQSPPSPISSSSSCGSSLVNLVACMSFLQAGAKNNKPTPACCTALASEVDTSAVCVCQMLTTTKSPLGTPINNIPQGIPINQSRALTLPGACKISTPTLTQCMSAAVGAGAPVGLRLLVLCLRLHLQVQRLQALFSRPPRLFISQLFLQLLRLLGYSLPQEVRRCQPPLVMLSG